MEFVLRKLQVSDAESLALHANNRKIADNLRNVFPHPYTVADANAFIADCGEKDGSGQLVLAIVVEGEAAGTVGVFIKKDIYARSAELGYWLSEKYWGNGIVTEAVAQMLTLAFERFDIVRVYAEPFAHNTGSRRVLEKSGFELEGTLRKSATKNGQTFDSCIYSVIKED